MANDMGLGFYCQRFVNDGAVDPDPGPCGEREYEALVGTGRRMGINGTYEPGAYQRAAVHNGLCGLCESSSGAQMVAWIVSSVRAFCGHDRAVACSQLNSLRAL